MNNLKNNFMFFSECVDGGLEGREREKAAHLREMRSLEGAVTRSSRKRSPRIITHTKVSLSVGPAKVSTRAYSTCRVYMTLYCFKGHRRPT